MFHGERVLDSFKMVISGIKTAFYTYMNGKYVRINKFEMFQTIISLIDLIPPVFTLAYVEYLKLKSRYNLRIRHFDMFA